MKVFEVKETLIIDEDTNEISVWIVEDVHNDKTVFFVKDNEVIVADEEYMKTLMEVMKMPLINEEENDDPCKECNNNGGKRCDDCPFA